MKARRRIGIDCPLHGADEIGGQIGSRIAQGRPSPAEMRLFDFLLRAPLDRIDAGDEVVEQDAEAVDVGPRGPRRAVEHLRREIQRRAGDIVAGADGPNAKILTGPEIHQHGSTAGRAHHVARLHVAVYEPGCVHRSERLAQIAANQRGFARAERSLFAQHRGQCSPVDELHPDADASVDDVRPVHRNDVDVADAREQARFFQRAGQVHRAIRGQRNQLQRDAGLQPRVAGAVDGAEGSLADRLERREMTPAAERSGVAVLAALGGRRVSRLGSAMECGDLFERVQFAEHAARGGVAGLLSNTVPVDAVAIGNRAGDVQQSDVFRLAHATSPRRAVPARG